jgi:hypothetical protein
MAKMILDYDPMTGISHWVDTDEETGITNYGCDQEVAAILDMNKEVFNGPHAKWGDWTHVACIPMAMFEEWEREGITSDQKKMRDKLNDPEFRYFRTRPGNI